MGIEDIHSHFHDGLLVARSQPLAHLGMTTARQFDAATSVSLRTVQGVAFTPDGFGRVVDIAMDVPGRVTLTDEDGAALTTEVEWEFALESR
jgi:hypothetical protein